MSNLDFMPISMKDLDRVLGNCVHLILITVVFRNLPRMFFLFLETVYKGELASLNEVEAMKLKEEDPMLFAIWEKARNNRDFEMQLVFFLIEAAKFTCLSLGWFAGFSGVNFWATSIIALFGEFGFSYYRHNKGEYKKSLKEFHSRKADDVTTSKTFKNRISDFMKYDNGTVAVDLVYKRLIRINDDLGSFTTVEGFAELQKLQKLFKLDMETLLDIGSKRIPEDIAKGMLKKVFWVM